MSVNDYVQKTLLQKRNNEGEPTKFTVALNPYNIRRLDYIANVLDVPRSTLAKDLIIQALNDIAVALNLNEVDDDATEELERYYDPANPPDEDEVLTKYGTWVRKGDWSEEA